MLTDPRRLVLLNDPQKVRRLLAPVSRVESSSEVKSESRSFRVRLRKRHGPRAIVTCMSLLSPEWSGVSSPDPVWARFGGFEMWSPHHPLSPSLSSPGREDCRENSTLSKSFLLFPSLDTTNTSTIQVLLLLLSPLLSGSTNDSGDVRTVGEESRGSSRCPVCTGGGTGVTPVTPSLHLRRGGPPVRRLVVSGRGRGRVGVRCKTRDSKGVGVTRSRALLNECSATCVAPSFPDFTRLSHTGGRWWF